MKRDKISSNVIRRLPRYLRKLDDLAYHGIDRISSGQLGKQMGLTPSQIRQDFSCFGEFGQQGYGYNVEKLREEISQIMGLDSGFKAILVGVGNMGRALINNFNFNNYGFNLCAGFDASEDVVGKTINETEIFHIDDMEKFISENEVTAAILCVPRRHADNVANSLATFGIKAIWNFTNTELTLEDDTVIIEDIHFSDSLMYLSYRITETLPDEDDT